MLARPREGRDPEPPQDGAEAVDAVRAQHPDGRHVERAGQGLRGGHGPGVGAVEVLRVERADVGRHVGHELGGEHLARLEHRGVEQRLEDAAGAAGRRDDVHVLAVLFRPRRPVVPDVGQHLAGRDVENERGRVVDAVLGQGAARASRRSRSRAPGPPCAGSCAPRGSRPPRGSAVPAAPPARAPPGGGRAWGAAPGRAAAARAGRAPRSSRRSRPGPGGRRGGGCASPGAGRGCGRGARGPGRSAAPRASPSPPTRAAGRRGRSSARPPRRGPPCCHRRGRTRRRGRAPAASRATA